MTIKKLNIQILLFTVLITFIVTACSNDDSVENEPTLEVTANNIQGSWELIEWNGMPMADGTYVYIEFTRRDRRFTLYQNEDSFMPRKIEGDYNIVEDEEYGAIIRGQYDYNGEWSHRYIVSTLTANSMTWIALDDPSNIQVFQRCSQIPF